MKQTFAFFVLGIFWSLANAQDQLPLSLISSFGDIRSTAIYDINNQDSISTITWTLGETFIGSGSTNNQSITIGEQQAIPLTTGANTIIYNNIKVYPNPTSNYVRIDNLPVGNNKIRLTDFTGNIIQSLSTTADTQTILTNNLASGVYILTISQNIDQKIAYKIVIAQH
jgi:Secretion system C-terminal sorting domain